MNSSVSNTSTPIMNPGGNNSSTPPLSQECAATILPLIRTCSAELRESETLTSKVPMELQDCYDTNSCTREQNQEFLKLSCPIIKKFNDCIKPAMECFVETMTNETREGWTRLERECDAFSASSGSTNTTTSGNNTTTSGNDTTTSGNDTINSGNDTITSGNGKNVASLFSILAFSLFLL